MVISMAHRLPPPLILALVCTLLILPSFSHATTKAMFTEPLQFLFGGQNLTDGDLTLSLANDCGLIIYKAGTPVVNFETSTTTSYCALSISEDGQLLLIPDNELTPTQTIGKKTYPGRYALLFMDGNLGIFGPGMWDNGVKSTTTFFNTNYQPTLNHENLKTGSAGYILFSGNIATGSANGDVVIAQNGNVSTVITKQCTLAVKDATINMTIWETRPKSDEPTECSLELKSNGELFLQRYTESGVVTQWTGGHAAREKLYVCLLRYYGGITTYGLKIWLYHDGSSSFSSSAAVAATTATATVVTEQMKMAIS